MEFPYEELLPDYIRLLTLHPGEYTDPLTCTVQAKEFEAVQDQYDALSYSWATEDDDVEQEHPLLLNGIPVLLTRNLYDGLKRIRPLDKALYIWIDALCINQADDAEKSVQVARMADIYAGAKSVIIWLGEGNDAEEDKLVLGMLERIPEIAATGEPQKYYQLGLRHRCLGVAFLSTNVSRCPGCTMIELWDEASSIYPEGFNAQTYGANHGAYSLNAAHADGMWDYLKAKDARMQHAETACDSFRSFMTRRYWRRRWIIQELYNARNQYWYWGSLSIDVSAFPVGWLIDFWDSSTIVVECLERWGYALCLLPQRSGHVTTTHDLVQQSLNERMFRNMIKGLSDYCMPQTLATRGRIYLYQCLESFAYAQCSNPKDM